MGATASLAEQSLQVEPGSIAIVELLVRNDGSVVDEFHLSVSGPDDWAVPDPPSLSLFPGAEGTATIRFSPPRTAAIGAGPVPFAVRVGSREDPAGSTVEEGIIEVAAFIDHGVELIPRTARGRWSARYELAVDNRSNVPIVSSPIGIDPDFNLRFHFRPTSSTILPGSAAITRVTTRPVRRYWRGPPASRPFAVQVGHLDDGIPPIVTDATMLQEAVLPSWLFKALALFAAVVLALVALWFGLLRPTIRSQARMAARQQAAIAAQKAGDAAQQAKQAKQAASAAQAAQGNKAANPGSSLPGAGSSPAGTGSPPAGAGRGPGVVPGPTTTPTGGSLALTVPVGQTQRRDLVGIPRPNSFQLTDVVFENNNGDTGSVAIMRGNTTLVQVSMANYRDLDYHFVSPISFPAGTPVTFTATCANAPPTACQPGAYLGGYLG